MPTLFYTHFFANNVGGQSLGDVEKKTQKDCIL